MASAPDTSAVAKLLSQTTLGALLKEQQHIVTIKDNASVDQTLRVLASRKILSAPVVSTVPDQEVEHLDTAVPHDCIKDVAGFIDIRDVLSSFLQDVDLPVLKDAKMLRRMRILEAEGTKFATKPLKSLKSLGSDGWFYPLSAAQHASLREIVHDAFINPRDARSGLFGGTRSRKVVHRLALFDKDGQLTHVVSQTDVIRFVWEHIEDLGPLAQATVKDLGFVTRQVLSVKPETPALDAMVLMEDRSISALAVVNGKGAIIGNFSVSELRSIMSEHFGSLALPVGEFLALEHGTEYAGYAVQRSEEEEAQAIEASKGAQFAKDQKLRRRESRPGSDVGQNLITCCESSTLAELLDKVVHNRLHRVYICDDNLGPIGVITLTDILRKLLNS